MNIERKNDKARGQNGNNWLIWANPRLYMGGPWNILTTFPCLESYFKKAKHCLSFPALKLTIYIFTVQCIFCDMQILKCFQMHPTSWYSSPCVTPSLLCVGGS